MQRLLSCVSLYSLAYVNLKMCVFVLVLSISSPHLISYIVPPVDGLYVLIVQVVLFLKVIEQLTQSGSAAELVLRVERVLRGLTRTAIVVGVLLGQSAAVRSWTVPENASSVAR